MSENVCKEARAYAWNYFALHAGQRMSGFHFFLVVAGLILGAMSAVEKLGIEGNVTAILPLSVTFLAFVFWRMDRRTRMLVKNAESALKMLENEFRSAFAKSEGGRVIELMERDDEAVRALRRKPAVDLFIPVTYSDCFNLTFVVLGGLGLILGVAKLVA